ncbi:AraC family transcriptional regulator [Clostridium sp. D2Q-11]|uniref:AraC family transcriptional regulator n=1 Tax=Anaeromonas frigoriresistens TaxID=2683708 RepID=A0A942UU41_9FIRM|nr:AraC family transcriptional regulator [Anaeromonas frigoriresistens]MBS4537490.1 AraC family transcriptional regulator [Anaeromonas frigoriresistens]
MESWEKINAVQRMQEFIEDNITKPISLKMLAQAAGYSPWHSARIFKELVGKTPFEYIRCFRLSQAVIKLRDEDKKIIDVAFDFVFNSHEGFTRAFSKQFGMAPSYYSKNTPPVKLFIPYPIRDYYLTLQKGENSMNRESNTDTVFVQVVDRPKRKLILKRGIKAKHYFGYCEEIGCDEVWGILTSIKEAMYEPIGMWLPDNLIEPGTSTYAQGVEVPEDYTGEVPEGFDLIDLPSCKMMVFQGEPFEDEKFEDAIYQLWEVMKNYNPEIYGFKWAEEDGPRFQLMPMGYRGYIEARPVRELNNE